METTSKLRDDILATLELVIHELEGTNAWGMMSAELRCKLRAGIVRMNASDHLNPSANEAAFHHLDQLLEREWESKDWMFDGEVLDTIKELGRRELLEKIEKRKEEVQE